MGEKNIVNAVTKFRQSEKTIHSMTEYAVGHQINEIQITELAGGLCNAVYLIEADGKKMVLKIATDPSVKIMRHEKDYVPIEASMLRKIGEQTNIPMPRLLCYDASGMICMVPYFFMSYLPGRSLNTIQPFPSEEALYQIKKEVGLITRQINEIPAPHFGIPAMPGTYTDSNGEFVMTLFRLLLKDAADLQIEIPGISPEELLALIGKHRETLDEVKQAVYAHTDTWNGNLMVENDKLTGIVDFAAILFGDPLISHDFHDFGDSPTKAFLEGYGIKELDQKQKRRVLIYRIWQCLGMIVERGFRKYEDINQYTWVFDIFKENVALLRADS